MSTELEPAHRPYCAQRVVKGPSMIRGVPHTGACQKPAKYHEDGKDWCVTHAPTLVRDRDEKRLSKERERWAREAEYQKANNERLRLARIARSLREATDDDVLAECRRRGLIEDEEVGRG